MEEKNMMREKLVQVLQKGRESVTQMKSLIHHHHHHHHHHHDGGSVNQMLKAKLDAHSSEVLTSFSSALSIINNTPSFNNNPILKSEDLQFGDWVAPTTHTPKDARGCYKRRKTEHSVVIETLNIDDGHAWRKYGQKLIQNTAHPRHYYRCTHKNEQGCKATKQVQQITENPAKYKIIYHGHHSCKNSLKTPLMYLDFVDEQHNSSTFFSFETPNNPKHGFYASSSSSSTSSSTSPRSPLGSPMSNAMVEQEYKRIKVAIPSEPSDLHHGTPSPSSSSGFLPTTSDLTTTTANTSGGLSLTTVSDEVISLAENCSSVATPHDVVEDYSYIMDDFFDINQVFQDFI